MVAIATLSVIAVVRGFNSFRAARKSNNRSSSSGRKPPMVVGTDGKQRVVSKSELLAANGQRSENLYVAVKDPFSDQTKVFDVSKGRRFYAPGGPYHMFSGRDASFLLATSCVDVTEADGDLSSITAMQKDTLTQWYMKYTNKYPIVGYLGEIDAVTDLHETKNVDTRETKKAA